MGIRFSLVFPLAEERGITARALSGWIRQTLPADRFELIVVADRAVPLDPDTRSLLRHHDRVLRGDFTNLAHQFDAGVRAGTGEYLFLTESHCIPAPNCLEAMDRWLAGNSHLAGACCESVPVWGNAYQAIDAQTFEEGFRHFINTNDWRKFSVHGMALRRDTYLACGGLPYQYGRFAEMVLAAALRDAGQELGHARESVVTHHYRETLQELIDGTEEYVASECVYRAQNPGPDRIGHSYQPDRSNPFSPRAAALQRDVVTTLLVGTLRRDTRAMSEALNVLGHVVTGLLGRRGPVLAAWLAVTACRLRCWWNRHDATKVNRPYRELGRLASVQSRVRFLASRSVVDPALPNPSTVLSVDALPEWSLHGFHGLERWNGEPFRWTKRVAAMQLPLKRGQYRLRLVSGGIPRERMKLRVAMNGTRIVPLALPNGDHELRIEPYHCHPREQTLVLVTNPLCPWRQGVQDYRELGLPLFAVEAHPASASQPVQRAAA